MPNIPYTAESFHPSMGPAFSGRHDAQFTWAELVHAAITVGRQNWSDVLRHGNYSVLEILWRIAMLRANLRSSSGRIAASDAYRGLDRSEKGAVSFFLGMCLSKVFAERLFGVPWLLHLDVYRAQLNPSFSGSERPDFVGMDPANCWVVIEAKGRTGSAPASLLDKAKDQTRSLSTICGCTPILRIAFAAYFSSGLLRTRIRDPEGHNDDAPPLWIEPDELARAYYAQLFEFVRTLHHDSRVKQPLLNSCIQGISIPGVDISLRMSELLSRWYLGDGVGWDQVCESSMPDNQTETRLSLIQRIRGLTKKRPEIVDVKAELPDRIDHSREDGLGFVGGDQVAVSLGESWANDIMALEPKARAG